MWRRFKLKFIQIYLCCVFSGDWRQERILSWWRGQHSYLFLCFQLRKYFISDTSFLYIIRSGYKGGLVYRSRSAYQVQYEGTIGSTWGLTDDQNIWLCCRRNQLILTKRQRKDKENVSSCLCPVLHNFNQNIWIVLKIKCVFQSTNDQEKTEKETLVVWTVILKLHSGFLHREAQLQVNFRGSDQNRTNQTSAETNPASLQDPDRDKRVECIFL